MKSKLFCTSIVGTILSILVCTSSFAFPIRSMTPPKLGDAHLGRKILCHRPMRRGSPRLDIQRVEKKVIFNNYGHGGSGWTLGPGSAHYVISLLEKEILKSAPVAVVGAGALGLFSALDLIQRGYKDITIIAENFDDLVSHSAGGLLAPVSMDNDPRIQKLIEEIGLVAYRFYSQVAAGEHPLIKTGARIVPAYFPSREESGLEPYVVAKVMRPAEDVTLDFGNGTKRDMVVYDDGIFMDTGGLMNQMMVYLRNLAEKMDETGIKVRFEKRKITSFKDVSQDVIVNCTGIGSAALNQDNELVPVQGHLILLKDQNPKDLEQMILMNFGKGTTKNGFEVKRSFYIFPKHLPGAAFEDVGVIGGTFIEGADEETPNEEEFGLVVERAKKFYGIQ